MKGNVGMGKILWRILCLECWNGGGAPDLDSTMKKHQQLSLHLLFISVPHVFRSCIRIIPTHGIIHRVINAYAHPKHQGIWLGGNRPHAAPRDFGGTHISKQTYKRYVKHDLRLT
jgi:hypothetical protein